MEKGVVINEATEFTWLALSGTDIVMLCVLNDHLQIECGDCFEPKFLSIILTIPFWLN